MMLQNTPPPMSTPHTTNNPRQTSNHFYYHYLLRKFSPQPLSLIEALSLDRNHLRWTPSPNSSINAQVDRFPLCYNNTTFTIPSIKGYSHHYANENDITPLLSELKLRDKDSCSLWRERDASSSPSHLLRKHLRPDQMEARAQPQRRTPPPHSRSSHSCPAAPP